MIGGKAGSASTFSGGGRRRKGCGQAKFRPISREIASIYGRELDGVAIEGVVVRGGGLDACKRIVLRKSRCCFDEVRGRTESH